MPRCRRRPPSPRTAETTGPVTSVTAATIRPATSARRRRRVAQPPCARGPARKLIGTVGKGGAFTITLTDARGKRVRTLKAGTYTIVVHDDSPIHNFELEREHGFEKELTDVSAVGTKTVRLKLTRGSYKAYCDPHESTMFQNFTVR